MEVNDRKICNARTLLGILNKHEPSLSIKLKRTETLRRVTAETSSTTNGHVLPSLTAGYESELQLNFTS